MSSHHRKRRIQAVRTEEPNDTIAARAAALRPFLGRTREEHQAALRRLLRTERRAAHCGVGYDAVRHAALRRLMAEAEDMKGDREAATRTRPHLRPRTD
ncbi:MAG: hypothetical protein K0S00_3750 [Xanthobacteraceae bacterium]|jgi:hypothetical protein|nr:hypothetical protein [Xanthobacteraceae bacterium]